MAIALIRREETQKERYPGRMPYDDEGQRLGDASTSQALQGFPAAPEAGRGMGQILPLSSPEETNHRTP